MVHGDEFPLLGSQKSLDWIKQRMADKYEAEVGDKGVAGVAPNVVAGHVGSGIAPYYACPCRCGGRRLRHHSVPQRTGQVDYAVTAGTRGDAKISRRHWARVSRFVSLH